MPRYIVKLPCDGEDFFLEWSSIVDAPVTYGMTLEEFETYYKEMYGQQGMQNLPERMARVNESGTSDAISRDPVKEWLEYNRAGEDESQLTFEEIIDEYVRQPRAEGIRGGPC